MIMSMPKNHSINIKYTSTVIRDKETEILAN